MLNAIAPKCENHESKPPLPNSRWIMSKNTKNIDKQKLFKKTNADRQKPECKLPTGSDEVSLNVKKYIRISWLFGKCYINILMFFRIFDVNNWLREISPSNPWFHIQMVWKTYVLSVYLIFKIQNSEDLFRTKGSLRTCFPRISDHAEISVSVIVTCNVVVWLIQHHIMNVLFVRVLHLQQEKMHDLSLNAGCQSI